MIWINGRRVSDDAAHVSARDRGLTLSDGVFETMRAHAGTVFRFDRHLARLSHALHVLEIPERPEIREWVTTAVRAAGWADARVRLTVTRGEGPPGLLPPDTPAPTVLIGIVEAPPVSQVIAAPPVSVHVASGRRNEYAMTAGLKTAAYTDNVVALLEARRRGADDALFLDVEGHCSEATASNLFVWIDGMLMTPPRSCGVLPGIARETVLEVARALGLQAVEQPFALAELQRADEAFLTNVTRVATPLVRVNGEPIGAGEPGPVTRQLAEAYATLFARETAAALS